MRLLYFPGVAGGLILGCELVPATRPVNPETGEAPPEGEGVVGLKALKGL